jgi:hypothetical protein
MGGTSSLAFGPDGTLHLAWTDMRDRSFAGGTAPPPFDAADLRFLHMQFVYYAKR